MTEQFLGGEAFRESTDLEEKESHSTASSLYQDGARDAEVRRGQRAWACTRALFSEEEGHSSTFCN